MKQFKTSLVFTTTREQAEQEIAEKGGQVLHYLGPHILVISVPAGLRIQDLRYASSKSLNGVLGEAEKLVLKAWRSTRQQKVATRTREITLEQTWDAGGHQAPGHYALEDEEDDHHRARSTGIPTSLYMTGKVAVGLILVSGDSWTRVSGSLIHVSIAADGTVWGVNGVHQIYRYKGNNQWQRISGSLKQISVGSSGNIWGVNAVDEIYQYKGNNKWERINGRLKHVSAAADGTVWGVNSVDEIYRYKGGEQWEKISGRLKQISVGNASTIWGVNSDNNIYRYKGGGQWEQISGKLKYVSVTKEGAVFGVNAGGNIYRYLGGNDWQHIPGNLMQIAARNEASLWGVNTSQQIYTGSSACGLAFSSGEQQKIVAEVIEGLNFLVNANPSANLSFVYDLRVINTRVTPGPVPGISNNYEKYEAPWRNDAMRQIGYTASSAGVTTYVQQLRTDKQTDWAYAAFFTKYPLEHFAYAGGVRLVMDYANNGWGPNNINAVFAHETCHIFGAADEYGTCSCGNSGQYHIPNNNCKNCTTNQQACLMNANTLRLCQWSQGQIGWSFWKQIGGSLMQVSVAADGTVWGVNSSHEIYRYKGNGQWEKISGSLKQISVGSAGSIWGVNAVDEIYMYKGNNNWERINGRLKHVSVAADGTVWGVNAIDDIYRYLGNNQWQKVSGKLKQVSVGNADTIWGVNVFDNIYRYLGNNQWQQISGKLKHVSVAADGTVWGVNSADNIYRYLGNNQWQQISGALNQISIGDPKLIWGVNDSGQIFERQVLATP